MASLLNSTKHYIKKKIISILLKSLPENWKEGNTSQLTCDVSIIVRAIQYSSLTQMQKTFTK